MSGSQITTSVTILNSLIGYHGLSLTNMTATTEPQIAAGSKIEIAGAFFTFNSNESVNATSWTAATTGGTAYIALTPSGTAGSQIVSAAWTSTAPEWSTTKQGWYTTAGSSLRVVAGCTKTDATTWTDKFIMQNIQEERSRKLKLLTTASVGTNLTVGGTASVTSNLTVGGNAQITGTATVTSNITGESIKTDNVFIKHKLFTGNLDGSGDATFAHGLTVTKIVGTHYERYNGTYYITSASTGPTIYHTTANTVINDDSGLATRPYRLVITYEA